MFVDALILHTAKQNNKYDSGSAKVNRAVTVLYIECIKILNVDEALPYLLGVTFHVLFM